MRSAISSKHLAVNWPESSIKLKVAFQQVIRSSDVHEHLFVPSCWSAFLHSPQAAYATSPPRLEIKTDGTFARTVNFRRWSLFVKAEHTDNVNQCETSVSKSRRTPLPVNRDILGHEAHVDGTSPRNAVHVMRLRLPRQAPLHLEVPTGVENSAKVRLH